MMLMMLLAALGCIVLALMAIVLSMFIYVIVSDWLEMRAEPLTESRHYPYWSK